MSSNRSLVPNAKEGLKELENKVLAQKGYHIDPDHPENTKYEVAGEVGVPLKKGYNGDLTAKEAGKIGGNIGGDMVKELIKLGEESLKKD